EIRRPHATVVVDRERRLERRRSPERDLDLAAADGPRDDAAGVAAVARLVGPAEATCDQDFAHGSILAGRGPLRPPPLARRRAAGGGCRPQLLRQPPPLARPARTRRRLLPRRRLRLQRLAASGAGDPC